MAAENWRVFLEPRFMRPPAFRPIPGAERTVLAGGALKDGEPFTFSKAQREALGTDWAAFQSEARKRANADWERVTVRFERDARQVILYAELRSVEPVMASVVMGSEFGSRFSETIGENFLLAVPNRHQAFVFPRVSGFPFQFSGLILAGYAATSHPVSVELFEFVKGEIRAVGIFER